MGERLILRNGRVWTGTEVVEGATLVAEDGVLAFVGRETIERRSGDVVIDAGGRLVAPGWWDAHAHLAYTGATMQQVPLKGTASVEGVQRLVAERVAAAPPGAWVQGSGWDQNDWQDPRFPTRAMLDVVAPDNPVMLIHTSGHCAWVNSAALREAGVTGSTAVPDGGTLPLDDDGEPAGMLFDRATDLVAAAIPSTTAVERRDALLLAARHAHSLGVTGVHAMDVGGGELASLEELHGAGELDLRVRVYLSARHEELWEGRHTGDGDDWLRIGGVKWFGDGALGSLTAWMYDPYEGNNDCGFPLQPVGELEPAVRQALEAGLAPAIHAIGDRANGEVLGLLERVRELSPGLPRRIEHAQLLGPGMAERMAVLGVTASVQPIHATQDMAKVDRHWGRRGEWAYPFRRLADAGVNLAFGSDTPVETMDPLAGIHAAVTRQRADGTPAGGWYPGERVSMAAALRAYSEGAAAAAGEPAMAGRLASGYAADCVVLSHDILAEPSRLLEARVDLTVAGGRVAYARPGSGLEEHTQAEPAGRKN